MLGQGRCVNKETKNFLLVRVGGFQKRCVTLAKIRLGEMGCQTEKYGTVVPASFLLVSIGHVYDCFALSVKYAPLSVAL